MADRQQFANNAVTTMAGTLSSGGSSFSVASGTGSLFPALSAGQWFEVTVYTKDGLGAWTNVETMKITGRTADTFTVGARDYSGQVGNPAGNAYDGITDDVFVEMLWTAESAESLQDYADAVVAEEVVEVVTHAATSKTTPVDADEVPLVDSAASWGRKKLTWANAKATLKTYFDTLYATVSHNHSGVYEPADADTTKNDVANTFTAQQSFTGTSATAPAIAGASDPNTGVFFPAADTVAVATNGTERMRVDSSGNVGIGRSPTADFDLYRDSGTTYKTVANGSVVLQEYASTAVSACAFGTTTNYPLYIKQNNASRFVFDINGNALHISSTGAIGYGVGGSVTQATSKSTAVTLNKPTGQIIMNSGSLAANTTAYFIFNNSLLYSTDVVLVSIKDNGAGTGYKYQVWPYYAADGVVGIALRNITAGALTETVTLNFAIIRGVNA